MISLRSMKGNFRIVNYAFSGIIKTVNLCINISIRKDWYKNENRFNQRKQPGG